MSLENNISIGDCTYISSNTSIYSNVKIGKFCSIAPNVQIAPGEHEMSNISTHPFMYNPIWRKKLGIKEKEEYQCDIGKSEEFTKIGNDVWIALNAFIKRGVTIGDGAVIGACSVVTKDVEPYSIVVGNPARHIRYRFKKEEIEKLQLLKEKWWNLTEKQLEEQLISMYDINKYLENIRNNNKY